MDILYFCQLWAGLFYLLNKIFFCIAELKTEKRKYWRIRSWVVYLVGLPGWIIIFISERNWIAASVEAGGAPTMLLGLVIALRGKDREPKYLDLTCVLTIIIGIICSFFDFGGISTLNQVLEIGIVSGFLIGTYMLAKENPTGYLWFLLMNASNGILMLIQDYYWLSGQQAISFVIVLYAYILNKRNCN